MLTSISPVGEHGRGQRWPVTVAAHLTGSTAGGAVTGGLLGAVGMLTLGWLGDGGATAVLAVLAVVAAVVEPRIQRVPTWRRQVDEDWLTRYRGWVYGLGFGFQLGAAYLTIVSTALVHLTFAAALLTRSVAGGALVGAVFGAVRALPLLTLHAVRDTGALATVHRRLDRARRPAAALAHGVLVVAAVVLTLEVTL